MKVRELIEELQKCNPEQDVLATSDSEDFFNVEEVKTENQSSVVAWAVIYIKP